MAETNEGIPRSAQRWANYILGLLVFALGVILMLAAFYWGYRMLQGVDGQIQSVQTTKAADNPATPAAKPGQKAPVVQATPPPKGGPTLLEVASAAILKLVILLVLAFIGAMTASRGAQMAGVRAG